MEEEFDLIECPDCAGMVDDPQYTCTTCWCEGGDGVLRVRRPTPRALDLPSATVNGKPSQTVSILNGVDLSGTASQ